MTAPPKPPSCPRCRTADIAWEGGSPPHGPDNWACCDCGHTWTTPGRPLIVDSLASRLDVLSGALATWAQRDDTKPQAEVRQAANTAMAAVDDLLGQLHVLRSRLVGEIRRSDDASAARADALLARGAW